MANNISSPTKKIQNKKKQKEQNICDKYTK